MNKLLEHTKKYGWIFIPPITYLVLALSYNQWWLVYVLLGIGVFSTVVFIYITKMLRGI